MNLKVCQLFLTALIIAGAQCARAEINLVVNGSFEGAWQNGPVGWMHVGPIGGWFGMPDAADGRNFADVLGAGTLYQDLATTPGVTYHLRYALAGIWSHSTPTVVDVQWGTDDLGIVTWNPADHPDHTFENVGWVWIDLDITATASSTRLAFSNPLVAIPGSLEGDALLDAVSVVEVPEPTNFWLFSVVLLGRSVWKRLNRAAT